MNRRRLFRRLVGGAVNNVAFTDMVDLVEGFGLFLYRSMGATIYSPSQASTTARHRRTDNLQRVGREAKPYQIRQFLRLVERNQLRLED